MDNNKPLWFFVFVMLNKNIRWDTKKNTFHYPLFRRKYTYIYIPHKNDLQYTQFAQHNKLGVIGNTKHKLIAILWHLVLYNYGIFYWNTYFNKFLLSYQILKLFYTFCLHHNDSFIKKCLKGIGLIFLKNNMIWSIVNINYI